MGNVDGPGTATPLSSSFFLKSGVPAGEQLLEVSLSTRDGTDQQGIRKTFLPGRYNFSFWVCQGECGSSHPHSKDFGRIMGTFNMTGAAPSPSPTPPSCFEQMDEKSCESTKDITGEACQWCEDFF